MLQNVIAISVVAIIIVIPIVCRCIYDFIVIRKFERMLEIYVENYEAVKQYVHEELNINQILSNMFVNVDMSAYTDVTYTLEFGTKDQFKVENTKEMRKVFIFVGNFILDYEDLIRNRYEKDYRKTNQYKSFMEALISIRRTCISKNEKTDVKWQDFMKSDN